MKHKIQITLFSNDLLLYSKSSFYSKNSFNIYQMITQHSFVKIYVLTVSTKVIEEN